MFTSTACLFHRGTECLNIYGTHVTAHNSTTNDIVFFIVSDLKIIYYNNY